MVGFDHILQSLRAVFSLVFLFFFCYHNHRAFLLLSSIDPSLRAACASFSCPRAVRATA